MLQFNVVPALSLPVLLLRFNVEGFSMLALDSIITDYH